MNTSRLRKLDARSALVDLARPAPTLESVFDPCVWLMLDWLALGSATALTLSLEPAIDAEPAEMLATQQTETRPATAVAATTR